MPEKFTRTETVHRKFRCETVDEAETFVAYDCVKGDWVVSVKKINTPLSLCMETYFYRSYQRDNVKTDVLT